MAATVISSEVIAPHVAFMISEYALGDAKITRELIEHASEQQLLGRSVFCDPLPATPGLVASTSLGLLTQAESRLLLIATLSVTDSAAILLAAAAVGIDAVIGGGAIPYLRFGGGRFRIIDDRVRSVIATNATTDERAEAHWALAHAHRTVGQRKIAAWHACLGHPREGEIRGQLLLTLADRRIAYGDFEAAFEIARLAAKGSNGTLRTHSTLMAARAAIWCGYFADAEELLEALHSRELGRRSDEATRLLRVLGVLRDGPEPSRSVEARAIEQLGPLVDIAMTQSDRGAMKSLIEINTAFERSEYEDADAIDAALLLSAVPSRPRWPWSTAPGALSPLAEAHIRLQQTAFQLRAEDRHGAAATLYDAVERLPLGAAGAGIVSSFIRMLPQTASGSERLASTFDALAPRRPISYEGVDASKGGHSVAASILTADTVERQHDGVWRELVSPRERQVADMVVSGHSNSEIAAQLALSVRTVEVHLTRVFRKLGLRSRTELVARALRAR